jgi:hypothetical protein
MLRIGHISDLHLNGSADRRHRVIRALGQAVDAGAEHVIISGDLTAHGRVSEHEELASILYDHWPYSSTVVPGNHDSGEGFTQIFVGVGAPRSFPDALIIPIDTRAPKRALFFRALGAIGKTQMAKIDWLTRNVDRPTILVMHHGPQWQKFHPFDGLIDRAGILRVLGRSPLIHVCCGHDHRVLDFGQTHTAASCALHPDPLRLYDVGLGKFGLAYRSEWEGTTGFAGVPR